MAGILLVDDSAFMRAVIRTIIINHGFAVAGEAKNGKDGFEKYKQLKPDAVIMDVTMDEMSGLTALKLILGYDPNAVVIMLSSIAGQQWLFEKSVSLGAKAVLAKPVNPDQLNDVLAQYIHDQNLKKSLQYSRMQNTEPPKPLVKNLNLTEADEKDSAIIEDTSYLKSQLITIITACEKHNKEAVYTAIILLKTKQWKKSTLAIFEEIHDILFLHGNFDETAARAKSLLETI